MVMLLRFCRSGNKFRGLFNYQKMFYSYEGDGKTTMSFLSRESEGKLLISGYNKQGFRLNSGLFVIGPVVLFPKTILSWNVADDNDINEDSLSLFYNLEPSVDVLIIGLSDTKNSFRNQSYYMNKMTSLKKSKLNLELLPTEKAIATFNFLSAENRFAAAALIPPKEIQFKELDCHNYTIKNQWSGKDDYFLGTDIKDETEIETKASEVGIKRGSKGRSSD